MLFDKLMQRLKQAQICLGNKERLTLPFEPNKISKNEMDEHVGSYSSGANVGFSWGLLLWDSVINGKTECLNKKPMRRL